MKQTQAQAGHELMQPSRGARWTPTHWTVLLVVFCLCGSLVTLAIVVTRAGTDTVTTLVGGAATATQNLVSGLSSLFDSITQPKVTAAFESYVISSQKQLRLNVADWAVMLRQRKSEHYFPAAHVEVEVNVPVKVPLYVTLQAGKWDFIPSGTNLYVLAPPLELGEPAYDARKIMRVIHQSSWRVDEQRVLDEAQDQLLRTIRPKLDEMMVGDGIREVARAGVTDFVHNWFVQTFPGGKDMTVKVVFPDESLPPEVKAPK